MGDWTDSLTLDMIPESYKQIAKAVGIREFIKLARVAGGTSLYIPKADKLLIPIRDKCIKKEFNGYNQKELAIKYNLSERWIIDICSRGNLEGQLSVFEDET